MNDQQLKALNELLANFVAHSSHAGDALQHATRIQTFVANVGRPWSRTTLTGHLTASAWVLDGSRTHVALIHHKKLNRWLQPGGHIDDSDASWRAAAQRETTEETGLAQFLAQPGDDALFDVDVHAIPARPDEPAHFHYDLRFLLLTDVDATQHSTLAINLDESHDCRWFALTALAADASNEVSMLRMIELSIRQFPG